MCRLCMCVKSQTAYERRPRAATGPDPARCIRAIQRDAHEPHLSRCVRGMRSLCGIRCVRGPATLAVIVYSFEKTALPAAHVAAGRETRRPGAT